MRQNGVCMDSFPLVDIEFLRSLCRTALVGPVIRSTCGTIPRKAIYQVVIKNAAWINVLNLCGKRVTVRIT